MIAASLDSVLDPVDQADVSRHLSDCVPCRATAAGYTADESHLRDAAAVAPPAWVESLVIDAARSARPAGGQSWARARPRVIATLIGVATIVAMVVVLGQALR